jgi:hypothetical protein
MRLKSHCVPGKPGVILKNARSSLFWKQNTQAYKKVQPRRFHVNPRKPTYPSVKARKVPQYHDVTDDAEHIFSAVFRFLPVFPKYIKSVT